MHSFKIYIIILVLSVLSCKSDDRSNNQAAVIGDLYADWVDVTNTKDINKWSGFVAPDAVFLPPDTSALESFNAIKGYYSKLFQDPHFKLECEQLFVEVAESQDIAWSRGVCRATFTNKEGKRAEGSSKWTKVWIRSRDGTWKCRLNTWNYN